MLQRFVSKRFQVLFHSPPGVLFTFPSRYLSAIGHQGVFRLSGWSRQIHTEFQEFRVTWDDIHEGCTYVYTTLTHYGQASQPVQLRTTFITRRPVNSPVRMVPQPPTCNACQLSHTPGLASSAFARHYSRNHFCFLFLWVLRCFTSPRSLQLPYIFRQRLPDMTPVFQGFPIRKSTDQSSFTSSPWLIAGYNVLHRLLMPRHPPTALSSLSPTKRSTKSTKMLASTIQFSNNNPINTTHHPTQEQPIMRQANLETPHPDTKKCPGPEISEPNNVHTQHPHPTSRRSTPQQGSTSRPTNGGHQTRSMLPQ